MGHYLIVGASGYVGARLTEHLLAQGHTVRGLVRTTDSEVVERLAARGMAVWQGDLTRPESLVGVATSIEHVFNLTSRMVLENGQVRRLFVEGNRNLIAACSRSRSVRSYLFAGNVAPYGDRGDTWLSEDAEVVPCYPLGTVMVDAEQAILDLVRRHSFPAIILRVGLIYGPDRDPVNAVLNGTDTLIGNGRNFVSRIHIDDLVDVLARLAVDGQPGGLYNIGDDEPVRAGEFLGEVRQRLGLVPPRALKPEAALFAGIDPSIVGMSAASVRMSNERLKLELGLNLRFPSVRMWLEQRLPETEGVERELVAVC